MLPVVYIKSLILTKSISMIVCIHTYYDTIYDTVIDTAYDVYVLFMLTCVECHAKSGHMRPQDLNWSCLVICTTQGRTQRYMVHRTYLFLCGHVSHATQCDWNTNSFLHS